MSKSSRKKQRLKQQGPAGKKESPLPPAAKVSGYWRVTQVLLLGALGITLYLAFQSLREGGVAGCGPNSGCHKVLTSRWAYLFGIPVSVFAATLYTSMLAAIHSATHGHPPARKILSAGGLLIIGAAVWFIAIQAAVLKSFCWFCLTAHLLGILGAVVLLVKLAQPQLKSILGAMALLGLFILGQAAYNPKTYVATTFAQSNAVPVAGLAQQPPTAEPPKPATNAPVSVMNGQFTFAVNKFPYTGSLASEHRLVKLFDFTCHYCRDLHFQMEQAKKTFPDMAVFSLPVPLDADCNRLMRNTQAAHANSCEITRIALAVWNAAPEKYGAFEARVWAGTAPTPEVAATWATELMGDEKYRAAYNDPAINEQIEMAVNIYEANSRQAGRGSLPQLLFPGSSIVGAIRSPAELLTLFTNNFVAKAQSTNAAKIN